MDHAFEIKVAFPSRFEELEFLDQLIEVLLSQAGFQEDVRSNLALSIREAAANAIFHGNGLEARKLTVVSAVLEGEKLEVEVADEGSGFDLEAVPDPLAPENLLKPTGRGILLMNNFMDDVEFEFPDSGGTIVRLSKVRAAEPSARPEPSA